MRTASSSVKLLPFAHPVGQQVGLDRAVRNLADVGARVREGHHRVRGGSSPAQQLLVLRVEAGCMKSCSRSLASAQRSIMTSTGSAPLGGRVGDRGVGRQARCARGCRRSRAAGLAAAEPSHARTRRRGRRPRAWRGARVLQDARCSASGRARSRATGQEVERQAGLERRHAPRCRGSGSGRSRPPAAAVSSRKSSELLLAGVWR